MTLKHFKALNSNNSHQSSNNKMDQMDSYEENEERYKVMILALEKRCAEIKKSNEALAARSKVIRKLIKRRSRDVEILKARLDKFGDSWRFV
ncbi:hypothetical protein PVAND_001783 [Polypedilum vanderplanki]|uniref:INO80 complex subunit F domain-containing protein n=1 Tax=Polypedilum vanderplanki TaxID=319348 RepID=A0A9J6BQB4_POLVA|nr:hypothetical protein PVAND_001783 [Polypedilum vanderplanki]